MKRIISLAIILTSFSSIAQTKQDLMLKSRLEQNAVMFAFTTVASMATWSQTYKTGDIPMPLVAFTYSVSVYTIVDTYRALRKHRKGKLTMPKWRYTDYEQIGNTKGGVYYESVTEPKLTEYPTR